MERILNFKFLGIVCFVCLLLYLLSLEWKFKVTIPCQLDLKQECNGVLRFNTKRRTIVITCTPDSTQVLDLVVSDVMITCISLVCIYTFLTSHLELLFDSYFHILTITVIITKSIYLVYNMIKTQNCLNLFVTFLFLLF